MPAMIVLSARSSVASARSTFSRAADWKIVRVAKAPFGPFDPFSGIWHLFALLSDGVKDWEPKYQY